MTDVNELELPTIDPEMESEAQAIANHEDELAEFINNYKNDRWFRLMLKDLWLTIMWEDRDECYALYVWDDIEFMSISYDKCVEKMFYFKNKKIEEEHRIDSTLPF